MKKWCVVVSFLFGLASPAFAQFGSVLQRAQQAQEAKKKFDDLSVSEEEERKIGEEVSAKIRARFGVVQDPAVHKYVTLVGTAVARESERPKLNWTFVVLDTDGVNAFAAPGGIVHITRGALALIQTEAELAGVLGHEITHVAHKHAVNAIQKSKAVQMGTEKLNDRGPFLDQIANKLYEMILENKFDRNDELDADRSSVMLSQKLGYSSGALADFLVKLDDRNKDQPAQNGLFASHPETKERIDKVRQLAGSKPGATVAARFKSSVSYQPTDVTAIATVVDGSSGLTASTKAGDKGDKDKGDKKDDQNKNKGGSGLSNLTRTSGPERQSAQVQASGGSRGVGPDRAAKGGSNPSLVRVTVSNAEIDAFRKGIV
jgi:predicted Zn-dependent protease